MVHIITSIQDSANYIKLEESGNLILTPDIKEATKFTDSSYELTKLIKYQSAYNASSRYMTVISQMTELIVTGLI